MKLFGSMLTSVVLLVVSLTPARAQNADSVIKVSIPFEFNVGHKTFPAGDYSVTEPLQHFVVLRDARGQSIASAFTHGVLASAPPSVAKLTFHVSGDRYFLSEVWRPDDPAGQQLTQTKNPAELAKSDTVSIQARLVRSQRQ